MKKIFTVLTVLTFFTSQFIKAQVPSDTVGAGNALQFDGSISNYVTLGPAYKTLTFPFTIQAWVYLNAYPSLVSCIFALDEVPTAYAGFNLATTSTGEVGIDFGDDVAGGSGDRRGYNTNNSIQLDQWTQVTAVCKSVTNVSVYFDGVLQNITNDKGGSQDTMLTHSLSGFTIIGNYWVNSSYNPLNGQIDEVRLWNIALDQSEVQNTMCEKISANTDGLLGYWRADEAGASTIVNDYTSNGIYGTIVGTVTRVASDAPIGNVSANLYASDYSGESLKLRSSTGDSLILSQITGLPYGVHIYAVNTAPFDTSGLISAPTSYFGVFCVNGSSPTYQVTYHYSLTDGTIVNSNQGTATLAKRIDATDIPWTSLSGGTLNTAQQTITETSQPSPQEYSLDVKKETGIEQLSVNGAHLSIYPNPGSGEFIINCSKSIDEIKVTNILGQLIYQAQPKQTQYNLEINAEGIYFVTITSGNSSTTGKVIVN